MSIVFHIGSPKTGSTFLQHYLAKCDDKNGALYYSPRDVVPLDNRFKHSALARELKAFELGEIGGTPILDRSLYLASLIPEETTCVFSSEGLVERKSFDRILESASRIEGLKDRKVHFLVYVRDPVSYVLSWYNQVVKNGKYIGTFSEFLRKKGGHHCKGIFNTVRAHKRSYGDMLTVRPYIGSTSQNVLDNFFDYLESLGRSVPDDRIGPDLTKGNRALGAKSLAIVQEIVKRTQYKRPRSDTDNWKQSEREHSEIMRRKVYKPAQRELLKIFLDDKKMVIGKSDYDQIISFSKDAILGLESECFDQPYFSDMERSSNLDENTTSIEIGDVFGEHDLVFARDFIDKMVARAGEFVDLAASNAEPRP